jgi:hypothetical protein
MLQKWEAREIRVTGTWVAEDWCSVHRLSHIVTEVKAYHERRSSAKRKPNGNDAEA